ncbi:MAG TPA: hypothetical protein VFN05_04600, partial [Actinomycetes bacterium]|nr:hypothetical protein [Actinomycetes bacterium]
RPPTGARSASCSPPGPRTTCTAAPTWPTPSPGSRPTRTPAPTSCTPRACRAFAFAAVGAVVEAATELREAGTYGFWQHASTGRTAAGSAFGGRDLEA